MTAQSTSRGSGTTARPLTGQTVRGLFWNYVSLAVTKVGGLIAMLIAARVLTPTELGLVAFATVSVEMFSIVKDLGLGAALIHGRDEDPTLLDTVHTVNLMLGLALTAATAAAALLVASVAGQPVLAGFLLVLGLSYGFDSWGAVQVVRLRSRLDFATKFRLDAVRATTKLATVVLGTLAGLGPWAFVLSAVTGSAVSSVVARRLDSWRPRLRIHRAHMSRLLRYGGPMTVADGLGIVEGRVELLVVGAWFGASTLGFYSVADRVSSLVAGNLLWVTSGVLFPAFALIRVQPDRLRQAVLDAVRFSSMIYVPVALGMCLVAEPLVTVLLGSKWVGAVPTLRLLALAALVMALSHHLGDLLKSLGRTHTVVWLSLADLAILTGTVVVGASLFGPLGVAGARIMSSLFTSVVRVELSRRLLAVPLGVAVAAFVPAAKGAASLAAAVLLVLYAPIESPAVRLGATVAAGACAYTATIWVTHGQALLELAERVFPGRWARWAVSGGAEGR